MSNTEKIVKNLKLKENRLKGLLKSITSEDSDTNPERKSNVKHFLNEIEEVNFILEMYESENAYMVTLNTLQKQTDKADFVNVEFDGEFCKIVRIQNFMSDDIWLLYIAPLELV